MTDDMMMGERDLEAEVKEKEEIIMSLRLNEHLLKDKLEISRRNMSKQLERITTLEKENKELKIKYTNLGIAITKAVEDLYRTEEVYLAGFDICRRITEYEIEYEMELLDNGG